MAKERRGTAKTATLQLRLPGREIRNVGVFLVDIENDRLYFRLIPDWHKYADENDVQVLQPLDETLRVMAQQMGGANLLELIATWSNTLQLVDEQEVQVENCHSEIDTLFREKVAFE